MPQVFKIGGYPEKDLRKLIRLIEANFKEICRKWSTYFERLDFYC